MLNALVYICECTHVILCGMGGYYFLLIVHLGVLPSIWKVLCK